MLARILFKILLFYRFIKKKLRRHALYNGNITIPPFVFKNMKNVRTLLLTLSVGVILTTGSVYAQKQKPRSTPPKQQLVPQQDRAAEGVKKIDEGKYDEAIAIFDNLLLNEPASTLYKYEKAFALYLKQDYRAASDIFKTITSAQDSDPRYYQLLGNCYDYLGEQENAVFTYQEGLKKFPNSGRLFMELGTVEMSRHDFGQAVMYWENGISAEPQFASNYYWAARFHAKTREKIWALIYGELFLNLEPDTKRSAEISELLFEIYKSALASGPDSTGLLKFSRQRTIISGGDPTRQPFELVYETAMTDAVRPLLQENPPTDLEMISRLRAEFLKQWEAESYGEMHPNILFERHAEMLKAGVFQAYNYWLLHRGAPDDFKKWALANRAEFQRFTSWVQKNPLVLTQEYKFNRYE